MSGSESRKKIDEVSNEREGDEIDKQSGGDEEQEEAKDGDNEEGQEIEELNDEREGEEIEEELEEENEEEGKSKLGEGFYEIEAIRKKRVHKGQEQYLIKWRDYPESANTWEPYDNLELCADVVEAFEQMSTKSPKSSRKRQRSLAMQRAWAAKKMKRASSPSPSPDKCDENENGQMETETRPLSLSSGERGRGRGRGRGRARVERPQQPLIKRTPRVKNTNKQDTVTQETQVEIEEEEMMNKQENEKVEEKEQEKDKDICINLSPPKTSQSQPQGVITGAKKRKSGCVRRFVTQQQGEEAVEDTNSNLVKQQGDDSTLGNKITKIIKTVKLSVASSPATNYVQQVSVTFQALRSDGTEVLVDNKELKATNPLLLIDYYERNLRYNPNP